MTRTCLVLAAVLLGGCSSSGSPQDSGMAPDTANGLDVTTTDSEAGQDTRVGTDATDTLVTDVSTNDARANDTGLPDVQPQDVGTTDTGVLDVGSPVDVTDVPDGGSPVCPPPVCTADSECQAACTAPFVGAWCCEHNACVADSRGCGVSLRDAGAPDASRCTTTGQCTTAVDCPAPGDRCCPPLPGSSTCGFCVGPHGLCPG